MWPSVPRLQVRILLFWSRCIHKWCWFVFPISFPGALNCWNNLLLYHSLGWCLTLMAMHFNIISHNCTKKFLISKPFHYTIMDAIFLYGYGIYHLIFSSSTSWITAVRILSKSKWILQKYQIGKVRDDL